MPAIHHVNASAATAWVNCRRRAWFDFHPPEGLTAVENPFLELVAVRGSEHEQAVREQLGHGTQARSVEHTQALIAAREALIYQPAFADRQTGLAGRPDFLRLEPDGHYRVIDAKLARRMETHREIVIQMAAYARLFPSPHRPAVILGDGKFHELDVDDLAAADEFLTSMRALAAAPARPVAHYSHSKCGECPYHDICVPDFERERALTLIYGLDRRAVPHLEQHGIYDYADLAKSDPDALADGPHFKGDKKATLVRRARSYLLKQVEIISAPALPPGPWVHFDVESDALANPSEAHVYLWGFLLPDGRFEYVWAEPGEQERKAAWQRVLSLLEELRLRYPSLVIAHYSSFEVQIIKRFVGLFRDEAHPAMQWLLGSDSPLVDLRDLVRDHLILPLKSYGLKAICKDPQLVNFHWRLAESGSQWSVVRYYDYVASSDPAERENIKQEILIYNEDDVRATKAMETWLRSFW